jgi:predicted HD phosphohydrolase
MDGQTAVQEILELLGAADQRGYIGEPVSRLEHALQCAHFARQANAPDQEVLAALLHDIGHLCAPEDAEQMQELGIARHEDIGAEYLETRGVADVICQLVSGHVMAKRYLVATRPEYAANLSLASHKTLALQGGPMNADEIACFEADPLFAAKIRVRQWDELGKQLDLQVGNLSEYEPLLRRFSVVSEC